MQKSALTYIQQYPWWVTGVAVLCLTMGPLPIKIVGVVLMACVAWYHPAIPLALVPATAPLYLIPMAVSATAAIPVHEVILIIATPFWIKHLWHARHTVWHRADLWVALLLVSATASIVWALPEGRGEALRTWRWIIVEPVWWLLLMRLAIITQRITMTRLVQVMMVAGGIVAGIGALQFIGIDLAPWLGQKRAFSDNVVATGNVRRVASVYGHANNLGLFLERIWPWALAALVVPAWRWRGAWPIAVSVAIGLLLSFSRGAWLATALASGLFVALYAGASTLRRRPWLVPGAMAVGIALVAGALLARGGEGGSIDARLLLWQESVAWLQQRPWGLGLGQFYFFHNPEFGHSIMDARLIGTSEQYAAHPHNLVLDIWLNLGPGGLIAIGALVITSLRAALRPPLTISARSLAAITLVAMLAHGSIDQFFFVSDLVYCFWFMILMIQVDTDQATPL